MSMTSRGAQADPDAPEYRRYLEVRDKVVRIKEREAALRNGSAAPSRYWAEELEQFDYMLDASPRIIKKLRQHTVHITGLRTYDYRSGQAAAHRQLEKRLRDLQGLAGKQCLVPEARAMGGFGFEIDGDLFNVDTLKFF